MLLVSHFGVDFVQPILQAEQNTTTRMVDEGTNSKHTIAKIGGLGLVLQRKG